MSKTVQWFHFYAWVTGRVVVASLRYAYVTVGDGATVTGLDRLRSISGREVFCPGVASLPDATPMDDGAVRGVLAAHVPVSSRWERS